MKGILDRFEGEYAVVELEDRSLKNILRSELPKGSREGDAIILVNGEWTIDKAETKERKARIENLVNDLFE